MTDFAQFKLVNNGDPDWEILGKLAQINIDRGFKLVWLSHDPIKKQTVMKFSMDPEQNRTYGCFIITDPPPAIPTMVPFEFTLHYPGENN